MLKARFRSPRLLSWARDGGRVNYLHQFATHFTNIQKDPHLGTQWGTLHFVLINKLLFVLSVFLFWIPSFKDIRTKKLHPVEAWLKKRLKCKLMWVWCSVLTHLILLPSSSFPVWRKRLAVISTQENWSKKKNVPELCTESWGKGDIFNSPLLGNSSSQRKIRK